jgi:acyl-CoA thioesterase-1
LGKATAPQFLLNERRFLTAENLTPAGIFCKNMIVKKHIPYQLLFAVLISVILACNTTRPLLVMKQDNEYMSEIKKELKTEWPHNRIINIVFHGHSVPSGYARTPLVKTFDSYPQLFFQELKARYPYAVVNIILTSKGGENSESGAARFKRDVLVHKPDVLFIDYALNDFGIGLDRSYKAWDKMIKLAKQQHIRIILMTPSPDLRINMDDPNNNLKRHAEQIVNLAKENNIGLINSFGLFNAVYSKGDSLKNYMAQINHPNRLGNQIIADEIMKWFR